MNALRDVHEERELGSSGAYIERMHRLFGLLSEHFASCDDNVVIEGIFAPGSHSLSWLSQFCGDIDVDMEIVIVECDIITACRRIIADLDNGKESIERTAGRLKLAGMYIEKFS